MTTPSLPDSYFHLNADGTRGRLKTYQERCTEEARQQLAEMSVRAQVAAETAPPAPAWQETYLDFARQQADTAHRPDLKRQAKERLRIAERAAKQHEEQVATEAKQAKFEQHEATRRAREHASALERTPPPHSDPRQVALAVAFARSNDLEPEALARRYFEHVAAIETDAFNRQHSERQRLEAEAYLAHAKASEAKIAELETAQRKLHAEQQL